MKNYWFSFSHNGSNAGVCIVEAECIEEAIQKTIDLCIHPENDDMVVFECDTLEEDCELALNRLYFREEMIELGYNSTNQIR